MSTLPKNYWDIRKAIQEAPGYDPDFRQFVDEASSAFQNQNWDELTRIGMRVQRLACSPWKNRIRVLIEEIEF